jgi:hypothetical protein
MNLYIQIDSNENTINHPVFEDNLISAFGSVPSDWEPFIRVVKPIAGPYQVWEGDTVTYQKVNGVWTDVWALRDMTAEEKATRQQIEKDAWSALPNRDNFTAWTFDETTCRYVPPTPKPIDENKYFWQGTTNSWIILPPQPDDEKQYRLDFATATWVLVTT